MKLTFKQFLSEIYPGVAQDEKQFKSYIKDIREEKLIGASEGFSIYEGFLKDKRVFVGRKDDDQKTFIGYLAGGYTEINGEKFWKTNYAYFDNSVRGKGYATAMYVFILKKLHLKIISDGVQSPDGRKLWASMIKKFSHKIYDSEDNKFFNYDEISEKELYSSKLEADGSTRYYLVLEKLNSIKQLPISEEHIDGYFREQTLFTATEFLGTYY